MKGFLTILLMAGLISACQSNKPGAKRQNKKISYSQISKSDNGLNTATINSPENSGPNNQKIATDSIPLPDEQSKPNKRSQTNFQGSSGPGTGGSYASSYYREQSTKKKNKKEMYKDRNFDHLYQDQNTAHLVPKKDTSKINLIDSNSVQLKDSTAYKW